MLGFAMDCWLVGMAYAFLISSGKHHKNDNALYKHMVILSAKIGLFLFALSTWAFSFGIMWSMWE